MECACPDPNPISNPNPNPNPIPNPKNSIFKMQTVLNRSATANGTLLQLQKDVGATGHNTLLVLGNLCC